MIKNTKNTKILSKNTKIHEKQDKILVINQGETPYKVKNSLKKGSDMKDCNLINIKLK